VPSSRAMVLGCEIDRLDLTETLGRCEAVIDSHGFAHQISINAAKLVAFHDDPRLREIIAQSQIVSPDGQVIVWASRLLGDPLPGRVNGTDLMFLLFGLAERKGYGVFILGAKKDVLEQAAARLKTLYPQLRLVGYRDGYFRDDEVEDVCGQIRAARPDILFVAMSSPRKEYWAAEHAADLGVPLVMGVGGSIDVVAGVTRRAPRWMQRSSLEWFYRLIQEPRRLWRRYFFTNTRFLNLLARELVARRLAGARG
jgi:N-acetylglucosaminyldiphosphoundecaprenol N-acetyl-beta-D-mannosaminyltransferase